MVYASKLLTTLNGRGYVADCTNFEGFDALLNNSQNPVPIYIGFDCTAASLHVGSLLQIMTLRHIQKSGHKPIVLMGGGTTKVGDPSGKDASRPQLTDERIAENMAGIKKVFESFLVFEDKFDPLTTKAYMVNNDEWLSSLNYIAFLRDYGKHFSVNRMLTRESVKQRLERDSHLSFLEFNYMILQAYDFVELNKRYGCRGQIGGSDQWGNIVEGMELNRRMHNAEGEDTNDLFGLTTPLLTTSDGKKMGKTADGAVWLNQDMLSAYDYWQFWRNCTDEDAIRFLKLFTELSTDEIADYEQYLGSADINKAKVRLANEATAMLHGEQAAKDAEATAQKVFEQGGAGGYLPVVEIESARLAEGLPAFKLWVEAGLAASGGEARRLVKGGGARLNNQPVANAEDVISLDAFENGEAKLSAGKKKHVIVKAV